MATQAASWGLVQVGQAVPEFVEGPVTVTDYVRYQGASGDMAPVHHDTIAAQARGFSRPIAIGMRQAGVVGTLISDSFGAESIRRLKVQFRELSWPDDVLSYSGRVVAKREEADAHLIDLEIVCTRQTGGVHLRAWATVALPE